MLATMNNARPRPGAVPRRALTLLETMVVITIIGVLIVLVAPSMREMIGTQRLRGIGAELVTDFQYARSEAVSRNQYLGVVVRNVSGEASTCYTLFTSSVNPLTLASLNPGSCNCSNGPGSACTGTQREVRTVQVPRSTGVEFMTASTQPTWFAYDPVSGSISTVPATSAQVGGHAFCVDVVRPDGGRMRAMVSLAGRASVCTPDGSLRDLQACPTYSFAQRNCVPF
jgi:type IV fimbrial biogenesis protein FimT